RVLELDQPARVGRQLSPLLSREPAAIARVFPGTNDLDRGHTLLLSNWELPSTIATAASCPMNSKSAVLGTRGQPVDPRVLHMLLWCGAMSPDTSSMFWISIAPQG